LNSGCIISVAFRPSVPGPRTGDLTISADGVKDMVVPLDAGTPINFGSVPVGMTSMQWVSLSTSGAVSGNVTGPFTITLQDPYSYGSIDGVSFGASASATQPVSEVFLGVQFQAAAPGNETGTITLSNGSTYLVTASVASDVQLSTNSLDFQNVAVGSTGGAAHVTLTNGSSSPQAISNIRTTAPFSATSDCGTSLPARASCTVDVVYIPTAVGQATGQLTISNGTTDLAVSLTGNGTPNLENATVDPMSIFLSYTRDGGSSPPQTITVRNTAVSGSMVVQGFDGSNNCSTAITSNCLKITSNNCSTVAPLASCQIQVQYLFGFSQGIAYGNLILMIPRGGTEADYVVYYQIAGPTSTDVTAPLVLSPSSLTFPPTPVGGVSEEQLLTLTNNSTAPLYIEVSAANEFSADSVCGVLGAGTSCTLHVRSTPAGSGATGGGTIVSGVSVIGYPLTITGQEAFAGADLQGYGIPTTSLASPSYPALVEPVFNGGPAPDGTYVHFTLPVKNTGSKPLVIRNTSIGQPALFSMDPRQCAAPIAPGGECVLNLTWDPEYCPQGGPSGVGDPCYDSSTLTLETNSASSPDSYDLNGTHFYSGNSNAGLPFFGNPAPIYFGRVQSGGLASGTLSFDGTASPIPALSITGRGFRLKNGCASLVGSTTGSCAAQITFAPTAVGFEAGTLRFVSNSGVSTNTLSGVGIPAQLRVSPGNVNFAPTVVFQSPPDQIVTLKNISSAPLALGATYIANGEFSVVATTCGTTLAVGGSCTMTLGFMPFNNVGPQKSNLTFSFGIDDGLETIPLSTAVTSLVISPSTADFGTVSKGQVAIRTFTIQNIGAVAQLYGVASIQGATLSGANSSEFKITANACVVGSTLSGSQTCKVTVQFDPDAPGTRSGTLTVATSNAGSVSAALAGHGKSPSESCGPQDADNHSEHREPCECDSDLQNHHGVECRAQFPKD
jgi:trimeric autotransporter adhesin